MDNLLIIIAGVALLGFLIVSITANIIANHRRQATINHLRFRPKKQLMTGAEKHCFQLLNDIFSEKFYIIPGVSLSTLLSSKTSKSRALAADTFDKHLVNFVLCNKRTLRPVCAIKIQDNIENNTKRNVKDLKKYFRSAHLPFVFITNPKKINRETIIEEFSRIIYETSLLDDTNSPKKSPSTPKISRISASSKSSKSKKSPKSS